jgi:hypothetical protein
MTFRKKNILGVIARTCHVQNKLCGRCTELWMQKQMVSYIQSGPKVLEKLKTKLKHTTHGKIV